MSTVYIKYINITFCYSLILTYNVNLNIKRIFVFIELMIFTYLTDTTDIDTFCININIERNTFNLITLK